MPASGFTAPAIANSKFSDDTAVISSKGPAADEIHVDVGVPRPFATRHRRSKSLGQWPEQGVELGFKAVDESGGGGSRIGKGEGGTKNWARGTGTQRRPGLNFMSVIFLAFLFVTVWRLRRAMLQLDFKEKGFWTFDAPDPFLHQSRRSLDYCKGRRVFMYELPAEYNTVVHNKSRCSYSLIKWMDLCPRFGHGGYGENLLERSKHELGDNNNNDDHVHEFNISQWFDTDFYMLEMIFHNRFQTYRCLTADPTQADAFFIPYYTGLKALDYLYEKPDLSSTLEKRKLFGMELIEWLDNNGGGAWRKHGGIDHFLILGRTSWDFQAQRMWGTGFSSLPYVANMTALILERDTRKNSEQAIPYPTAFHPGSREKLEEWIHTVRHANRQYLVTYVGAPRPDSWSVRGIMTASCQRAGPSVCRIVDCSSSGVRCSHDPVSVYKSFLQANFCLQPRGDSATRKSTFDCLISGTIPVFFHVDSAYTQYSWHLPPKPESYSVYIEEEDLRNGNLTVPDLLMSYSPERIDEMRRTIIATIPNLLYNDYAGNPWDPTNRKDAFELSVERVLERIIAAKTGKERKG